MGTKITPFNLHTSVDSHVKGLIDSDYVQARSGSGGTDSASTQAMIDSNFANMATAIHIPDGNGTSDNKITFGADSDLKIFHTGSNSVIQDAGTGSLFLQGSSAVQITDLSSNKMAVFNDGGSTEIYHNNNKKFETTDSGATVTGDLQILSTDGGGGNGPVLDLWRNSPSPSNGDHLGTIQFNFENDADEKIQGARIYAELDDDTNGTEDAAIFIDGLRNGSTYGYMELAFGRVNILSDTLQLKNNATVSFEGSTADDFETSIIATDPTADNTITLPDASGTILLDSGHQTITGDLTLTSTDASATDNPSLELYRNSPSPAVNDLMGHIIFSGEDAAGNKANYAEIETVITDTTDGSEDGILRFRAAIDGAMTTYYNAGYGANFFFKNVALHTGVNLSFEGATNNNFETLITVVDPTQDNTITFPDATGTVALTSDITVTASSTTTLTNKTLTNPTINGATLSGTFGGTANLTGLVLAGASPLKFEGSNDDANETTLAVQNPTADRTITLPNMTGGIKELLISEGSMNASSLVFNSSTITTEYSELRLVLSNCKPSTQTYVYMRVGSSNSADAGSNYGQALYYSGYYGTTSAYSINYVNDGITAFVIADGYAQLGTGTGQNGHFEITFLNPNTSSHYKLFKINSQIWSYYPMLMGRYIDAQVWKSTAAINYIQVYPGSGNLALEYKLYGVKS